MQTFSKRAAVALALLPFLATAVVAPAHANLIGTTEALQAATGSRAQDLARVEAGLTRADVRAQLERYGVDPADAALRAAALGDAELRLLAERMDSAPAGGNVLAVIGAVFVVLLILDYLNVINVFRR